MYSCWPTSWRGHLWDTHVLLWRNNWRQKGLRSVLQALDRSRLVRHNSLNDIIHGFLNKVSIPATNREPIGLLKTDAKFSDDLMLVPWRERRYFIWDVTVADITAISYLQPITTFEESAAEAATIRKTTKYTKIMPTLSIHACCYWSHVSYSKISALRQISFLNLVVTHFCGTSGRRKTSFLFQRLSVAIHRFNAVCIYDTFIEQNAGEECQ